MRTLTSAHLQASRLRAPLAFRDRCLLRHMGDPRVLLSMQRMQGRRGFRFYCRKCAPISKPVSCPKGNEHSHPDQYNDLVRRAPCPRRTELLRDSLGLPFYQFAKRYSSQQFSLALCCAPLSTQRGVLPLVVERRTFILRTPVPRPGGSQYLRDLSYLGKKCSVATTLP